MEKPEVESIEGLSPAISIDQKTTSRNPRSTVGTVTEEIKDEDPFVYKSIDEILENIVPTIEVIEIIKPVYNFKAS